MTSCINLQPLPPKPYMAINYGTKCPKVCIYHPRAQRMNPHFETNPKSTNLGYNQGSFFEVLDVGSSFLI